MKAAKALPTLEDAPKDKQHTAATPPHSLTTNKQGQTPNAAHRNSPVAAHGAKLSHDLERHATDGAPMHFSEFAMVEADDGDKEMSSNKCISKKPEILDTSIGNDAVVPPAMIVATSKHDDDDKKIPASKRKSKEPEIVNISSDDEPIPSEIIAARLEHDDDVVYKRMLSNALNQTAVIGSNHDVQISFKEGDASDEQPTSIERQNPPILHHYLEQGDLALVPPTIQPISNPQLFHEYHAALVPPTAQQEPPTVIKSTQVNAAVDISTTNNQPLEHFSSFPLFVATLVEDPSQRELRPPSPVYAVIVPDDHQPLPWWRRHRRSLFTGVVLVIICILIGVIIGIVIAPRTENAGTTGNVSQLGIHTFSPAPSISPSSTMAPSASFLPSPQPSYTPPSTFPSMHPSSCGTYRVVSRGVVGDIYGWTGVGIDGNDAVVAFGEGPEIHFLSYYDGKFEDVQTLYVTPKTGKIAMSGNVVVAGTSEQNNKTGAVYVFEKDSNGTWSQVKRIQPYSIIPGTLFGYFVAIDGDTIAIGAPGDGDQIEGSAFIYRRVNATWAYATKITSFDSNSREFGGYVSVKGNFVAVGDYWYGNSYGAVFVYELDSFSNSVKQQLNGLNGLIACDQVASFSLLMENKGLLLGCPSDNEYTGAVYFYPLSERGDKYESRHKITASDSAPGFSFGNWDQIAVDGNIMLVTTSVENGKVYVFAQKNNTWIEVTKIAAPRYSSSFGNRIALSGRKALISSSGQVYSYFLEDC